MRFNREDMVPPFEWRAPTVPWHGTRDRRRLTFLTTFFAAPLVSSPASTRTAPSTASARLPRTTPSADPRVPPSPDFDPARPRPTRWAPRMAARNTASAAHEPADPA